MKKVLYLITILAVFFITACSGIDVDRLSDDDLSRLSEKAIVCNKPYMRFGMSCCLDQNTNSICDDDEKTTTSPKEQVEEIVQPETTQSTTTTKVEPTTTAEYNLADYPEMFIEGDKLNVIGVVGDGASAEEVVALSDIMSSLQYDKSIDDERISRIEVGASKLSSEIVGSEYDHNLIIVGNPCTNEVMRRITKVDSSILSECDGNVFNGWYDVSHGRIILSKQQGHYYLIVSGRSPADIRATSVVLANYGDYDLKGNLMIVQPSTGIAKPFDEWDDDAFSKLSEDVESTEPVAVE